MSERLSEPNKTTEKSDHLNSSTDPNKTPRNQSNQSSVHSCQQSSSHREAKEAPCTVSPPAETQVTSSPHAASLVITSITTTSTGTVTSGVITTTSSLVGDVITTATSTVTGDVVKVSAAVVASDTTATYATTSVSDTPSNPKDTPTSSLTTTNANTTTTTSTTAITSAKGTAELPLQEVAPSRRRRGRRRAVTEPFSSSASTMVVTVPCDTPGELPHPTTDGVNGHALPQGTGENRDAPRNTSPLPTSPPASTIRHRERLIGPVTASVPPPPLRMADAQRNSERIASVNQQLRSRPVKRKLFEVDHEKVEKDVQKELKEIVETEAKRFEKQYELLPPERNPDAPRFYHSKEITSDRKRVAVSSFAMTTTSSSSPSGGALVTSSLPASTSNVALDSSSSANSENEVQGAKSSSGTPSEVAGKEAESGAGAKGRPSSAAPPEEVRDIRSADESPSSPPARRTSQRRSTTRRNPNTLESPSYSSSSSFTSPSSSSPTSSSLSSSLNLSTSSRSSSGVSSLESTPTQERHSSQETVTPAGTITPVGSVNTPTQGGETPPTAGRMTPTQETNASTQRPSTAFNVRKRRSTQSPPPPDLSRRRKPPRI